MRNFVAAETVLQTAYDGGLEDGVDFIELVEEVGAITLHIVFDAWYKELSENIRHNPEGQLAQVMSVVADLRASELHGDHDVHFFRKKYGFER